MKSFPPSSFETVVFYVGGTEEHKQDSAINVTKSQLFNGKFPVKDGIYSDYMGTTDVGWDCATCGNKRGICPGHDGSLDLKYPVKNPFCIKDITYWLKIICFNCHNLLTKPAVSATHRRLQETVKTLKKNIICPSCSELHPEIKYDNKHTNNFYYEQKSSNDGKTVPKYIYNHQIQEIFNGISDGIVVIMGKTPLSHPKKFILNTIRVPSNLARPDIREIGGNRSNNSDLTALLKTLIDINDRIPDNVDDEKLMDRTILDMTINLDLTYMTMIKGASQSSNVKLNASNNKVPNSIADRMKRKDGRFRRNLTGKRVGNMVRSVITGSPNIRPGEVGVPIEVAKEFGIPVKYQPYNQDEVLRYYHNGTKHYPGCKKIKKASTGTNYDLRFVKNYKLQFGDIVYRPLIDGDFIGFNRQPSLTATQITAHKVVVLETGSSLRMNLSACNLYNADFDGDAMHGIILRTVMGRNELSMVSKTSNWFISDQDSTAKMGAIQDSLIGGVVMSSAALNKPLSKWHAMQLMSGIDMKQMPIYTAFPHKNYNTRQIISNILPEITMRCRPKIYNPSYAKFITYHPEDTEVVIERGILKQGILDKKTIGENNHGGQFHLISQQYNSELANAVIYGHQKIVNQYLIYRGFTTGTQDIVMDNDLTKEIQQVLSDKIRQVNRVVTKMKLGQLKPPIGLSIKEFLERESLDLLALGDKVIAPVLHNSSDIYKNNNLLMVLSGSKGKSSNIVSIMAAVGSQTTNGKRAEMSFGYKRTGPYFLRYDQSPQSRGFIRSSFAEGIPPEQYKEVADEGRFGIISNALSTSIAGTQNRTSGKNLENVIIGYSRQSAKHDTVVQPLYAETGVDMRCSVIVKFKTIKMSNSDFKKLHTKSSNKVVQKALDSEFKQMEDDRNQYRQIMFKLEKISNMSFTDKRKMPVNVEHIMENMAHKYKDGDSKLDLVAAVNKIERLCHSISYKFLNKIAEDRKVDIPEHFAASTTFLQILIRSTLCTHNLIKLRIGNDLLDSIIEKIIKSFSDALIDYGRSVGIISSQSLGEPMTQYVLDSKHRSGGGGGTKTNTIVRIKEILSAKPTERTKNPSMFVAPLTQYECDEKYVRKLANSIEMSIFGQFVEDVTHFFEAYKKPVHPDYIDDIEWIEEFEKLNLGMKFPTDLSMRVIRFKINQEKLVIKNTSLESIIIRLQLKFPQLFLVYNSEISKEIIIRAYIRQNTKKIYTTDSEVDELTSEIMHTNIKGIEGIIATEISKKMVSYVDDNGSIKEKITYGINTIGSNIEEILKNPGIDRYRSQSDNIMDFVQIYGIEAARFKIMDELMKTMPQLDPVHCSIFADTMTSTGEVTSLEQTGLTKRDRNDPLLRMSYRQPIQVMTDAANNNMTTKVRGVSTSLVTGCFPKIGTTMSKVCLNLDFISKHKRSYNDELDDL